MREETKILIVDDERIMRETLRDILKKEGYKVTTASTGSEAIEKVKEAFFNVAIIDMKLPDINGLEVLMSIENLNPRICTIIITAYGSVETAVEALKKGAYDYIAKPFEAEEIIITIKRGLEIQRLSIESSQLKETIAALVRIIEAKDPYTRGYSEQVTEYAVAIAKELGLSATEVDNIQEAALLHDIGMVGVPERILKKPAELTEEEYAKVKLHPLIGMRILTPASSLKGIISSIYHHHERYDGGGYPLHMKGENIPLGARILAVADSYQAMISPRVYRKALSKEEAIEKLKEGAGKQFDPRVVDAFLKVLEKEGKE